MKTTPLPSVIEVFQNNVPDWRKTEINHPLHTHLLTQDRNQAYTRLVEGIDGMTYAMNVDEYLELVEKWEGKNYDQPFDDGYAQALKDIRENVVKPLYGKK